MPVELPWRSLCVAVHFATEQCRLIGLTTWSPSCAHPGSPRRARHSSRSSPPRAPAARTRPATPRPRRVHATHLRAAWTFSTGVLRGHEGQPLVVGNTMYVVTPYPNVGYALDLATEGQPLKWKVRPENAQAAVGLA